MMQSVTVRKWTSINLLLLTTENPIMPIPNYNAIQFHSKAEHIAALYDACLLIVNTHRTTDLLDGYIHYPDDNKKTSTDDFVKFARMILDEISGGHLQ